MSLTQTDYQRLCEIREEMMALLEEVKTSLRHADHHVYERAQYTWIGNLDVALGGGSFMDTYDHTFEKTLKELDPVEDEELDESQEVQP